MRHFLVLFGPFWCFLLSMLLSDTFWNFLVAFCCFWVLVGTFVHSSTTQCNYIQTTERIVTHVHRRPSCRGGGELLIFIHSFAITWLLNLPINISPLAFKHLWKSPISWILTSDHSTGWPILFKRARYPKYWLLTTEQADQAVCPQLTPGGSHVCQSV